MTLSIQSLATKAFIHRSAEWAASSPCESPDILLKILALPISRLLSTPRLFSKIGGPLPSSHHRASTSVQNSELTWLLCVVAPLPSSFDLPAPDNPIRPFPHFFKTKQIITKQNKPKKQNNTFQVTISPSLSPNLVRSIPSSRPRHPVFKRRACYGTWRSLCVRVIVWSSTVSPGDSEHYKHPSFRYRSKAILHTHRGRCGRWPRRRPGRSHSRPPAPPAPRSSLRVWRVMV